MWSIQYNCEPEKSQLHSDQRVDALIDIVDKLIRRDGL